MEITATTHTSDVNEMHGVLYVLIFAFHPTSSEEKIVIQRSFSKSS